MAKTAQAIDIEASASTDTNVETVAAIYEEGQLQLLDQVDLEPGAHVRVTIHRVTEEDDGSRITASIQALDRFVESGRELTEEQQTLLDDAMDRPRHPSRS